MNKYKVRFTTTLTYEVYGDTPQDALDTSLNKFYAKEGKGNRIIVKEIRSVPTEA